MALFSSTQPSLRARILPKFPAQVLAGNGINITKSGGTYTFSTSEAGSEIAVIDKGTYVSGTVTFVVSSGNKQKLTVAGPVTIAFTAWPPSGFYGELEIQLVNGGIPGIVFPTINWLVGDGNTSTLFGSMGVSLNPAGTNWILLWTTDGGATIWGRAI